MASRPGRYSSTSLGGSTVEDGAASSASEGVVVAEEVVVVVVVLVAEEGGTEKGGAEGRLSAAGEQAPTSRANTAHIQTTLRTLMLDRK